MDWWVAVLVMYLETIRGIIIAVGFMPILISIGYWAAFSIKCGEHEFNGLNYSERNGKVRQQYYVTVKEWRKKPVRKMLFLLPVSILLFLISAVVPQPETVFKIIALKYGADAVTSNEAKNLGNKAYEAMDKSLSILNSKLDEWNKKK